MKKKLFTCILALTLMLIILTSCNLEASKLEYIVNADGKSCTIMGIGDYSRVDVDIPSIIDGYTVTAIAPKAFAGSNIRSIALPSTLERIGYEAFLDCTKLTSVRFPMGNEIITKLDSRTFMGCTSLVSVDVPENISEIADLVFYGCEYLMKLNIPKSVNVIGSNAFENCYRLTSIDIPDGVKAIESATFKNCVSLERISIPDTLESVGNYAFQYC